MTSPCSWYDRLADHGGCVSSKAGSRAKGIFDDGCSRESEESSGSDCDGPRASEGGSSYSNVGEETCGHGIAQADTSQLPSDILIHLARASIVALEICNVTIECATQALPLSSKAVIGAHAEEQVDSSLLPQLYARLRACHQLEALATRCLNELSPELRSLDVWKRRPKRNGAQTPQPLDLDCQRLREALAHARRGGCPPWLCVRALIADQQAEEGFTESTGEMRQSLSCIDLESSAGSSAVSFRLHLLHQIWESQQARKRGQDHSLHLPLLPELGEMRGLQLPCLLRGSEAEHKGAGGPSTSAGGAGGPRGEDMASALRLETLSELTNYSSWLCASCEKSRKARYPQQRGELSQQLEALALVYRIIPSMLAESMGSIPQRVVNALKPQLTLLPDCHLVALLLSAIAALESARACSASLNGQSQVDSSVDLNKEAPQVNDEMRQQSLSYRSKELLLLALNAMRRVHPLSLDHLASLLPPLEDYSASRRKLTPLTWLVKFALLQLKGTRRFLL